MFDIILLVLVIIIYLIYVPLIIHFEIKLNPDLFYALHYKEIERRLKIEKRH